MTKTKQHIQSIVANNSHLSRLIDKAAQMSLVKESVKKLIAPDLASILNGISLHEDILTLITHNPEWATRLRFASTELLGRLREDPLLGLIKKIQIQISPELHTHSAYITTALDEINPSKATKVRAIKTISLFTAEQLNTLAEQVGNRGEDGKALQEVLKRLALRAQAAHSGTP